MQRISSVFRSRIYLLVSALFCLTTVVANASPELLCTPRWQVPNPCPHESGNCLPILKIDSKGKLYALDLETSVLSIFQPNGQLRGQYNLSLFFSWRSMVSDFLALDGNNVLVSAIDSKLYIYDVASRNLLPVQLKTPAYFEPCTDIFASLILGRLSRLGASGEVVTCGMEGPQEGGQWGSTIVVIDVHSGVVTTIYRGTSIIGGRPYRQVIAGPDGYVYAEPIASSSLNVASAEDQKKYWPLVRYNPHSQTWEELYLPHNLLQWFIAVDRSSNLYFSGWDGPSLQKVSVTGQIVWQLTQADFRLTPRIVDIAPNGHLFLSTADLNAPDEQVEECTVRSTQTF